jgi:hypothetical protein
MYLLSFSKKNSSNKKEEDTSVPARNSLLFTFKKWVIENNQAALDKKYHFFLISKSVVDQPLKKYCLKPEE